jgi:hypothetical protein
MTHGATDLDKGTLGQFANLAFDAALRPETGRGSGEDDGEPDGDYLLMSPGSGSIIVEI